jgi:hypothetical protein
MLHCVDKKGLGIIKLLTKINPGVCYRRAFTSVALNTLCGFLLTNAMWPAGVINNPHHVAISLANAY